MRPLRCLMVSHYAQGHANVVQDYLFSFNAYSNHRWYYVHDCSILNTINFEAFDVIVLFWTYYWPGLDFPEAVIERIASCSALKVMFLQDEYRFVRPVNAIMKKLGVQVMCTCVAQADHDVFYPRRLIPSLEATYTVLTGYVPDYLSRTNVQWEWDRPWDIGYRSRTLPYHLGDLGQEKRIIATRFEEIARRHGFRANISVREEDRMYGKTWLKFLRSCRCSLGTESGASVVDFSGSIQRRCEDYLAQHPTATYDEVKHICFADQDGKCVVRAISPRIFEACAYRNTLVLHSGHYSGILIPGVHYIEVRKDYSNIHEVVAQMRDPRHCQRLAEAAHADLIESGHYSYQRLVSWFDGMLAQHRPHAVRLTELGRLSFYAKNYLLYDQVLVPRNETVVQLPSLRSPLRRVKNAVLRFARSALRRLTMLLAIAKFVIAQPSWLALSLRYGLTQTVDGGIRTIIKDLYRLSETAARTRGGNDRHSMPGSAPRLVLTRQGKGSVATVSNGIDKGGSATSDVYRLTFLSALLSRYPEKVTRMLGTTCEDRSGETNGCEEAEVTITREHV